MDNKNLIFNTDITIIQKGILLEYWSFSELTNKWGISIADLKSKYDVTEKDIRHIRTKGFFYTKTSCSTCEGHIIKKYTSRTYVTKRMLRTGKGESNYWRSDTCEVCKDKVAEIQRLKEIEMQKEYALWCEEKEILNAVVEKYLTSKVTREDAYRLLGFNVKEIVKKFYKLKTKQMVYRHLFKNNLKDAEMWSIFESLNILNLIHIKRDGSDQKVLKFLKYYDVAEFVFTSDEVVQYYYCLDVTEERTFKELH